MTLIRFSDQEKICEGLAMIQDDARPPETWISSVEVEGLHNRLSFNVKLNSGVNIIYGKNGIGKTTLLHIIGNISEIDIDRFKHLSFKKIILRNNAGNHISLEKNDDVLSVFLNDQRTSYSQEKPVLSEVEREGIRSVVGERATYLPAFRSVLERMREASYSPYEERSTPEFEALQRAEIEAFRSIMNNERSVRRTGSVIDNNVYKTVRCRQWFGEFVPVVRYPSITDVVLGLGDEWTSAQLAISKIEQKQFESAFVEIFSAIAQGETDSDHRDQKALLNEIKEAGSFDDGRLQGPTRMSAYLQLVEIAEKTDGRGRNYTNILEIYRDKLLDRKREREAVLAPINAFQESVNIFLSEKALRIGSRPNPTPRMRDSNVFIEPEFGKLYRVTALSSGERQIVTMLYSASRSPFKAGCCLIDEPELSLHVDWQRIVLSQIVKQHQGRQIIACTHSPEVGAEHEDRVQFFAPQAAELLDDDLENDEGINL